MIMDGGILDAESGGYMLVAESVKASFDEKLFGKIQNDLFCIAFQIHALLQLPSKYVS
jgi:hypothetical protein